MSTRINKVNDWMSLARQANWSVETMAEHCGVSSRTLRRYFLKHLGITPKRWLTAQRQKQAMELLRGGSSVKETASRLGYQHSTTFSREFKKHCGNSPSGLAFIDSQAIAKWANVR